MKNNKIIVVFIIMIVAMFSGYFAYNHNQKVSLAKYYYDVGDYKKASDLKVEDISDKASSIINAMSWEEQIDKFIKYNDKFYLLSFDLVIENIYNANLLLKHGYGDKDFVDILNKHYKEIAEYLGTTENHLNEICEMDSEKSETEIIKLLNNK